ncbi:MAG: hypothetical protein ACYDBH_01395 [Acidobacteriaceae bacterium]
MKRKQIFLTPEEIDLLVTVIDGFASQIKGDSFVPSAHKAAGFYVCRRLDELRTRIMRLIEE